MKKLTLMTLAVLAFSLAGCAGVTATQTVGGTLLSMHDVVKTGAGATDVLCDNKTLSPELCTSILTSYEGFKKSWPVIDDAWVAYAKAPVTDTTATAIFNAANTTFTKDYAEIMGLLAQTGVLKNK